jgi:dolichol-phosphate mannosyltransferase
VRQEISRNEKLSIIIPTYHGKKNIVEVIRRTEKTLENIVFELIVVDDNSPDGTATIVRARAEGNQTRKQY